MKPSSRLLPLALLALLPLLACSSDSKTTTPADTKPPPAASPGEGKPCTTMVALGCPEGQIDACDKALAEPDTSPDAGDTGTMMAPQRPPSELTRSGHRCIPK